MNARHHPATGRFPAPGALFAVFITICSLATGCSNQAPTLPPADTVPPATTVLAQVAATATTIDLTWNAPGDDGRTGSAATYDLRRAAAPITPSSWADATPVPGEPTPGAPGTGEAFTVTGLVIGTTYHFALRTGDEAGNWSALSDDLAAATTPAPDVTPPAAVADLRVRSATTGSVTLAWTAPGDDGAAGTAAAYDLRRAGAPITEATWDAALAVEGEPAPAEAGAAETFRVKGLDEGTTWHFALRVRDEAGNGSALSADIVAATDAFSLGTFAAIPAGSFTMGSPADEPGRDDVETPHLVTLSSAFTLQATEMTQLLYRELAQWAYDHGYVAATAGGLVDLLDGANVVLRPLAQFEVPFDDGVFECRAPLHPVTGIDWAAAAACCDWLNLRLGLPRAYNHATWECAAGSPYAAAGYRLPTEAEWEYACRAGGTAAFAGGPLTHPGCSPLDAGLDALGWYCGNTDWFALPHAVAQKAPNAWGLYDMHGNAAELCHDLMGPNEGDATDPVGVPMAAARAVRGGDCQSPAQACRSAARAWEGLGRFVGFRMARTAPVGTARALAPSPPRR